MAGMSEARHALEKGQIIRSLKEVYPRLVTVATLLRALDDVGFSMTPEGLAFALEYLAEQEYVAVQRNRDMPGWRRDRAGAGRPDDIRFAKLAAEGLQLLDGRRPEDPLVAF